MWIGVVLLFCFSVLFLKHSFVITVCHSISSAIMLKSLNGFNVCDQFLDYQDTDYVYLGHIYWTFVFIHVYMTVHMHVNVITEHNANIQVL